ncbi:MAG: PhoU domain-containing protein [Halolamina sp.]
METRKVQQLGPSTLAMTLPAAWTAEYGVAKGDELVIHEGTGTLTATTKTVGSEEGEATIHVDDLEDDAVERAIIGQYVLGRRIIQVEQSEGALSKGTIDAVYRAEGQLMGLGIVEETPERITVRCSVDPSDFTLENLLERLESTGRTMREESVKALSRGNPELATRALNRERQANKIFVLLLRLVYTIHQDPSVARTMGLEDTLPLVGYRSIAKNLELTADNAEDVAAIVLDSDGEAFDVDQATVRQIRDLTDDVNEISALAVEALIERDYGLTTDVRNRFHEIRDREEQFLADLPELSNAELLEIREVLVSLQETAQYAMQNAEIAANLALHQESEHVTVDSGT